jgi:circadian clock protein KaiC
MRQISTGINGLDKMLNGGIPSGRCILVCGSPGAGKTILSWQFLHYGATQCNEPGLYVCLDEEVTLLKEEIGSFHFQADTNQTEAETQGLGWNIEESEKEGKLAIVDASPIRLMPVNIQLKIGNISVGKKDFDLVSLMEIVKQKAEKIKAKRLVIDPITALTLQYDDISERRTATLDLFETLQKLGTTNLITTELRRAALEREIRAEEYLAHGVIVLHVVVNNGQIVRGIQIEKMRGIPHDNQIRPYEIARKGISVFPQDKLFGNITSVSTSLQPFTVLSIT